MRHVLEHDYRWADILDNAVASFTERMALVLFTPLADETHEIAFADDPGVPDISFSVQDIASRLEGIYRYKTVPTRSQYGQETIFYVQR